MRYNRDRKKEICYIFRIRAEAEGSKNTLKKRHLLSGRTSTQCDMCNLQEDESIIHILDRC